MDSPFLCCHNIRSLTTLLFWVLISWVSWATATVTYDRNSLIINNKSQILFSGSVHYPRSTPEMWPDIIQKAKDGGLDVIETYVFWSGHEPFPQQYNFKGRFDLVRFIKVVQKAGLYVHLRIGPYVCAEWNFGGFPVWLKFVPGIAFRTNNEPFKNAMKNFTETIVNIMKKEKLFQPQGGPIILSQIENEYGIFEAKYGAAGKAYTNWATSMALNLGTGVPWVMCKQNDAPDPVINTCNGFYCESFTPNQDHDPKIWTELWTSWYTAFNRPVPQRTAEDVAFAVARFVQNKGSVVNYYMYQGGTNFDRTSGGPFVATSYDYDAPLDEYGLIRQPKWGHLKELHKAIKQCEQTLVSADPQVLDLGNHNTQEAHVFKNTSGACAAFLANYNARASVNVTFMGKLYELPRWSVSILANCDTETFNTARITVERSQVTMNPANVELHSWKSYQEDIPTASERDTTGGLLEQVNVTKDQSDYLWYMTTVNISASELKGQDTVLTVKSAGHGLHVFINGQLLGTEYGDAGHANVTFQNKVQLKPGTNNISLLSVSVGLPNIGFRFEQWPVGILGPVTLDGLNDGRRDLSTQKWSYKVGMKGEMLSLYSPKTTWPKGLFAGNQPLKWYRATFSSPGGNDSLAIDVSNLTMGYNMIKGQIWINGESIGRYFTSSNIGGGCGGACDYAGIYRAGKCSRNCGVPYLYHVPREFLNSKKCNTLVVFEEMGGSPTGITFVKRQQKNITSKGSQA